MGLLEVLKNKKVHYLYHANTVVTAITFLENNGLYSRQAVEDKGLFQTPQVSDETDKFLEFIMIFSLILVIYMQGQVK